MKRKGTKRSLGEFFRDEHQKLAAFVKSRIDDAADRDSEDIVQDVFLGIFDAADVGAPIENLTAYVYQALRNRIVDTLRSRKPRVSLDSFLNDDEGATLHDVLEDIRYEAFSEMEKAELREDLFKAIDNLSDQYRAIVAMTELEGRSFREISIETGVPLGTLLSRKSRAMAGIRKELAGKYLTGGTEG